MVEGTNGFYSTSILFHIIGYNQSYVDWCALSDKGKNNNKVKLTVTYDMGWQKISSGRRYESSSGHAFIIGGRSTGINVMVPYYKSCQNCDAAEKRGEEAEEHECSKNFEGSSKSMEASAILKMVEDAFYNLFFIIDVIVSNNDSTIRAVLNDPSIGVRGQVLKSPKGKLDEEISEPSFLTDLYHRVKGVAKHIFFIVNESRAQRCGFTKAYNLRLKKYWGYMIKKNMKKIEELSEASKVSLEHIFNSHDIVLQSSASRQEHQKKEIHAME